MKTEDRDRASNPFSTRPLRHPAARLVLIACIVGSTAALSIPDLAVAGTTRMYQHKHTNHAHEFSLIKFTEPTGILTLSIVALTVCLGLLRRVRRLKPTLLLKLHKIAGICALGSRAFHATIALLTH